MYLGEWLIIGQSPKTAKATNERWVPPWVCFSIYKNLTSNQQCHYTGWGSKTGSSRSEFNQPEKSAGKSCSEIFCQPTYPSRVGKSLGVIKSCNRNIFNLRRLQLEGRAMFMSDSRDKMKLFPCHVRTHFCWWLRRKHLLWMCLIKQYSLLLLSQVRTFLNWQPSHVLVQTIHVSLLLISFSNKKTKKKNKKRTKKTCFGTCSDSFTVRN